MKTEGISLEELDAQQLELLPDRQEMGGNSFNALVNVIALNVITAGY